MRDEILAPGETGQVSARFAYGVLDLTLPGESVDAFLQICPDWQKLGTFTTDANGEVSVDVPDLPQGDYQIRFVVHGDLTTADGEIAIWPRGVNVVVTDIDGTLTTDDLQSAQDYVLGVDAALNVDADTLIDAWDAKGYRIIYLTARLQFMGHYTRDWLDRHGFPLGIVHLTDRDLSTIPSDQDTQDFKSSFLLDARDNHGVVFDAAYGNAVTDIAAYEAAAIAKPDTYIIGDHGGEQGTVAVTSFSDLVPGLASVPDAVQP